MEAQRYSKKRDAIYTALCSTKRHPTAEWIYNEVKPAFPDLSLGTVYRNFAQFKAEGKLSVVATVNGRERVDACTRPHTHFVCTSCDEVQDLEAVPCPEALMQQAEQETGGKILRSELLFYGICPACKGRKTDANKIQTWPGK